MDFRTLNKFIVTHNFVLPLIDDHLDVLNKKEYFSTLDLKDGFLHIRTAPESQIAFEPVSLQTQIPFNFQTKDQFKILRTRNRSNPQQKTTKFGPKNITQIKQS